MRSVGVNDEEALPRVLFGFLTIEDLFKGLRELCVVVPIY